MDVFWKLYCTLDESGRKKLMKRYFDRPVDNTVSNISTLEPEICIA